MYIAVVALTMLVLPLVSIAINSAYLPGGLAVVLVGRWFVFWGVGVRLGLAGMRRNSSGHPLRQGKSFIRPMTRCCRLFANLARLICRSPWSLCSPWQCPTSFFRPQSTPPSSTV